MLGPYPIQAKPLGYDSAIATETTLTKDLDGRAFPALVAMTYLVVASIGALNHEPWRDEAFTWLILRESSSVQDLIDNLGYVGHPMTWYVLLLAPKAIANDYSTLIVVNLVAAGLAVFLFARYSRLPRFVRLLFPLGFFPLYQYGVTVRPYALMIAVLFTYCTLRTASRERPVASAAAVAVLASLHAIGFLLACGIVALEVYERSFFPRVADPRRLWMAGVLTTFGLAFSAWQLIPPSSESVEIQPGGGSAVLISLATGFLPTFESINGAWAGAAGLALFWFPSWFLFERRSPGLVAYALWTAVLAAMIGFVYEGYRWHFGFYFVGFLAALWLSDGQHKLNRAPAAGFMGALLLVHAAIGVFALVTDIRQPYSSGRLAADYAEREELASLPKVSIRVGSNPVFTFDVDFAQSLLVHQKGSAVYDPVESRFVGFWQHYARPHFAVRPMDDLLPSLSDIAEALGSDLLIIVIRPPGTTDVVLPPELLKVVDLPGGLDFGESMSLYRYNRALTSLTP